MDNLGSQMFELAKELYPLCRSITGSGLRKSLEIIQKHIPLSIKEYATGSQVFDWTIPKEWNIADAWIKNNRGEKVVDFQNSNLHVVNYSIPVRATMSLEELKQHLHSLPQHPDWIPFRTSFYNETWGFCLTHKQLESLAEGDYEVFIDSALTEGSLTLGEYYLQGDSDNEILISCHCCHPSLANDNLSGMVIATYLAKKLKAEKRFYSYRFLFNPVTIGSITWLANNKEITGKIKHGLVLACLGDSGDMTYKKSRQGNAVIDKVAEFILRESGDKYTINDFSPYGYDERQFCSPAFNLPVGLLSRTPHGRYPEYHTSADDLTLVTSEHLEKSYNTCVDILKLLEMNVYYQNQKPECEPQLGKRGLYKLIGGHNDPGDFQMAMLWMLNLSDDKHSLLDIAERSGLGPDILNEVAIILVDHDLLKIIGPAH